jgi:hypothetical protein
LVSLPDLPQRLTEDFLGIFLTGIVFSILLKTTAFNDLPLQG